MATPAIRAAAARIASMVTRFVVSDFTIEPRRRLVAAMQLNSIADGAGALRSLEVGKFGKARLRG
jgi:hypothetical protein